MHKVYFRPLNSPSTLKVQKDRKKMRPVASRLLVDGLSIACQTWKGATSSEASPCHLLCLHGWLDSSASFTRLAPYLAETLGATVVAIDLPGHGHSQHTSGHFQHVRAVGIVKEVLERLGWEASNTSVVGHSMGGGISLLFSGTFPEALRRVVLIDAFGPFTSSPDRAPADLRKFLTSTKGVYSHGPSPPPAPVKLYKSLADGINARVRIVGTYPGAQTISREAAEALVRRGARYCPETASSQGPLEGEGEDDTGSLVIAEEQGPISFRYDPRLLLPSPTYLTVAQVDGFCAAITCPVLVVQAEQGWPSSAEDFASRRALLEAKGLLQVVRLPGSHHLHLDPETASAVGDCVAKFLA